MDVYAWFLLVRLGSRIANKLENVGVALHEIHHDGKKDSPSGTAMTAAQILKQEIDRKHEEIVECFRSRPPAPSEFHVSSTRVGYVPGTHFMWISSPSGMIEIKHTAMNRAGFAEGALAAAEWIIKQPPKLYGMQTFMDSFLNILL
jgi:4-hydroxy-tetrahydrodipicolinate reductase